MVYVGVTFRLFKLNVDLKHFQDFLSSCHINMSFSLETEKKIMLKLCVSKIYLLPHFIEHLLLVADIVTLKGFYLLFINLVRYII